MNGRSFRERKKKDDREREREREREKRGSEMRKERHS